MRERIALAGIEASIGIVVLALFLMFGILAVVGVGIGIASGHFAIPASGIAGYLVGVVVVGWWTRLVVRDLTAVRVVTVEDDGRWKLTGPLGIPRGSIAADVGRTVAVQTKDTTILQGPVRSYTQIWAVIEAADGRRWTTSRGPVSTARRAFERLRDLARG
ncbi:MAG TPA: hypothetical protein VGM90_10350 [Kofleriaceae bacterium]|jgi:hypothetical protein